jgi:hypothetical protein
MIYMIAFGQGAFYSNISLGQVNMITLFFEVMALYFLVKDKIIKSTAFSSFGVWLKLYPALLFPLFIGNKKNIKIFAISLITFFIGLPIILSPIIPLNLYFQYFFKYMPVFTNLKHDMSPCNQSLMAFLMHFSIPAESFKNYWLYDISGWIKLTNIIAMILFIVLIFVLFLRDRKHLLLWAFSSLLAISPVFSVTGWEAVYILSLPLIIQTLYYSIKSENYLKIISVVLISAFFILKPPQRYLIAYLDYFPFIF